jgi:hypothetical protein
MSCLRAFRSGRKIADRLVVAGHSAWSLGHACPTIASYMAVRTRRSSFESCEFSARMQSF